MLKISDPREEGTYEAKYELKDTPEEECPIFILRKLTAPEVENIDNQTTIAKPGKDGNVSFLAGTIRRLKIDKALVDWKNVCDKDGNPLPFTHANKLWLPVSIVSWIEDKINEDNDLKGIKEPERKNS